MSSSTPTATAVVTTTSSTTDANPVPTSVVTIGLGFIAGAFLIVTSAFFARIQLARRRARLRGEPVPTFLEVFFTSTAGSGGLGRDGRASGGWGGMADVGFWGGGWGRPPTWAAGGRILNERMRRGGAYGSGDVDWSTKDPPKLWEVVLPPPGPAEVDNAAGKVSLDVAQWNPIAISRSKKPPINSTSTPTTSRRNSLNLHSVTAELYEASSAIPTHEMIKSRSRAAASVPLRATVLVAMPSDPSIKRDTLLQGGGEDVEEDLPEVCFGVTTVHVVLDPSTSSSSMRSGHGDGLLRDVKQPLPLPPTPPSTSTKAEVAHVEHVEHADGTPISTTAPPAGAAAADQPAAGSGRRKGKWRI